MCAGGLRLEWWAKLTLHKIFLKRRLELGMAKYKYNGLRFGKCLFFFGLMILMAVRAGSAGFAQTIEDEDDTPKVITTQAATTEASTTQAMVTQPATQVATTQTVTESVFGRISLTEQEVQELIKQSEMIQDESLRKKVLEKLTQALTLVQNSQTLSDRSERLKQNREKAPALIAEIKTKVSEPIGKVNIEVPAGVTLMELEQRLAQVTVEADAAEKQKEDMEALLENFMERREKLPSLIAKLKENQEAMRNRFRTLMESDDAPELIQAHRILLRAQWQASQEESQAIAQEMLGYEIRMEELRCRVDLANWTMLEKQKQLEVWREVVNQRRRAEAEQAAVKAKEDAAEALPAVKQLAEENASLAERLSGPEGLAAKIDAVATQKTVSEKVLVNLRTQFKEFQEKVDRRGVTNAMSLLLRKTRSELPDVSIINQQRKDLETRQVQAQIEQMQLEDQRSDLTDLDAKLESIEASLDPAMEEGQRAKVRQEALEAFRARKTYLTELIDSYDQYIWNLADLDANKKDIISETIAFNDYINEHILWFRSTSSLGMTYLFKGGHAVLWLLNPYRWYQAVKSLGMDTVYNSSMNGLVLLLFVILLVLKRRIRLKLLVTGDMIDQRENESFYLTIQAVVYTTLMAIVWPLILWFVGWRLEILTKSDEFIHAVSQGFQTSAIILLTLEIIRKVSLQDGLAEKHFRWDSDGLRAIRTNLSWLMVIALPAVFVTFAMEAQSNELWKDSLGRIAFMVLLIAFSVCFWRISGLRFRRLKNSVSRMGWLRYMWYPMLVIPVILAMLTWMGYYYTAMQLAGKTLESLWLFLLLLIVQEIVQRWLYLMNRRLAAAKIEKLKAQVSDNEVRKPVSGQVMPQISREPELKIYTISVQNRRILHMLIAFALVGGLWMIWNEILPALGIFRKVQLWEQVTLGGFALAVVIAVMTFVAGKNLPGLLEITLLHRLPLDAGLRFAITSICRYFIIVVGLATAFDLIGIGWAKVQWLIAAMTVGLGFGLQEIFANFVSGLIILFERPIRVGDIVTVGDVTGAVSRIHIRATTIIDWDRKEMIVPNKEFITGRVVNWTLSDRVIRLMVKVGVAYGSDTDKVQKLLLEAVTLVPGILKEPAPSAIFCGFGESSLDFELRTYIPNVDNSLSLRHALYTAINQKFIEGGVQIPFPQRDLHVRTIETTVPVNFPDKKE